jgi:hypothetical protein
MSANATPEELEAVRLRYRHLNPGGPPEPSPDEFEVLLQDVRERARAIEAQSMEMLFTKLREGRRTPRRHMRFAFATLVLMFIALAIAMAIRTRF